MSPKRPSQEELERDGIRVVFEYSKCCNRCFPDVEKRCKAMSGVSEVVEADAHHEEHLALAVTGVFKIAKLKEWLWKPPILRSSYTHMKRITILKEEKIGGGAEQEEEDNDEIASGGGAEQEEDNDEIASGGGAEQEEDNDEITEEIDWQAMKEAFYKHK